MNFIDTSPFYGRGMSEVLLGVALRGVPRDRYILGTKLGRYDAAHFDFSARRVVESVDVSLHRMGVRASRHHASATTSSSWTWRRSSRRRCRPCARSSSRARCASSAFSGYPMKMFRYVLDRAPLDVILSYNHYTLQNTMLADLVPYLKAKGVGIMNAAPFSARLLTNAPLPPWHKATPEVRAVCRKAAEHCQAKGVDIAQLALQFSIRQPGHGHLRHRLGQPRPRAPVGASGPTSRSTSSCCRKCWQILKPIHNWFYIEGRPENNDPVR